MRSTVFLLAIMLIAIFLYLQPGEPRNGGGESASSPGNEEEAAFHCEGKLRCAQMSSCDEAKFYQRNCPDVDLDDDDGVPCKAEWCKTDG